MITEETGLRDYATADLIAELETREGVTCKFIEPYEDYTFSINGPAVILVSID